MKVVILAGGLGTRLAEETEVKPKPMVEIGGRPILWHILKGYAQHGHRAFHVALGYKGDVIKRYFLDYHLLSGDLRLEMASGSVTASRRHVEDWDVSLADTGLEALTGDRVYALRESIGRETFMLTYGDGVSNVDLDALLAFHRAQGRMVTLTAVRPPARFGGITFDGPLVTAFNEKPQLGEGWINGGFMVLEPEVFDVMETGPRASLEQDVLERLAREGQLAAYRHEGFWQCMDTLRDKNLLESLWRQGDAPWKTWG